MTPEQRSLARNVKTFRIYRDLSKLVLGHRCSPQLSAAVITRIERPTDPLWNPSDDTLHRIARALGTTARVLRGESPLPAEVLEVLDPQASRNPDPYVRSRHRVLCHLLPAEAAHA